MQSLSSPLQDTKNVFYQKNLLNFSSSKNKSFASKTIDSENSEKKLFCEKCNKLFSTPGNLHSHITTIHDNYRPYKCDFPNCKKAYAAESKLIAHKRTHTGLRPFVCQICQKTFSEKGNLKTHLKFHSEIRPFKCTLCNKEYKSRGHLKDHIEIEHYHIKKFCCQYCNKYFGRISTLKVHIRIHTNEKRFECKFEGCGKKFTEKRNMEKHYARHFKNSDQTIKNGKVKKVYGSRTIQKDFEEKVKMAMDQLSSVKNKNVEEVKMEEKKENENKVVDVCSIKKNENVSQNCCNDIKYNNINNSNNNDNLNDMVKDNNEKYLKNAKISDNNDFINNNINNNINNISNGNSNYTDNNNNNFDSFLSYDFSNIDFIDNDVCLKNDYLDLDLNSNDLNENNDDFIFSQQNYFL